MSSDDPTPSASGGPAPRDGAPDGPAPSDGPAPPGGPSTPDTPVPPPAAAPPGGRSTPEAPAVPLAPGDETGPPEDGTVSRAELRTATIRGARVTLGVRMIAEVAALGAMVLLTRLIPPDEVGAAAVAVTFQMLSVVLTFEGFGSPLVQRRLVREEHRRTAHLLAVGSGFALAGLVVLFATTVAPSLFGDRAAELLMYTAPGYAIAGFGVVSRTTVLRRLDFRSQSTFEVLGTIAQVVVASSLAFSGVDGEALVIGPVVGAAIEIVLLMRIARPPRFGFDRRAFHEIASFGLLTSISGLVVALRRNAAYLVLAGLLPARDVGYYFRAFQLGGEYQAKLSVVMLRLGLPLFARSPDRETTNRLRSRMTSTNALATAPFLALLAVLAPTLIPWLFGEQWTPAAQLAQILAVAGFGQAVMSGVEGLAIAGGRPRAALNFNLFVIVSYVGVLALLADHGLVAICVGVSVLHVVVALVAQRFIVAPLTGAGIADLAREVGPAAVAATAAFGVGAGAAALGADGLGELLWFALGTALTFATYLGVLRLVFGGTWALLTDTVGLLVRRRRPTPAADGGPA